MEDSMKAQRQTIVEDKATNYQYDDIYYLSGRRMVDEKKLSQELFKVSFYDLTYSQAEQMLEHLRALPQPNVGHTHTCFSCGIEFICICISNANSETGECFNCREGISLTAHLYKRH
jgi:tRNA/tmRNA/rRNA uracil-C5-methylase (TrmA/RlmC/RlmD family)